MSSQLSHFCNESVVFTFTTVAIFTRAKVIVQHKGQWFDVPPHVQVSLTIIMKSQLPTPPWCPTTITVTATSGKRSWGGAHLDFHAHVSHGQYF